MMILVAQQRGTLPPHPTRAERPWTQLDVSKGHYLWWGKGAKPLIECRLIMHICPNFRGHLTINGLYKAEVIHRYGLWRSFEAVEFATLEWVDWFNNRRLLKPIGNIPPAEEPFYAALDAQAEAA